MFASDKRFWSTFLPSYSGNLFPNLPAKPKIEDEPPPVVRTLKKTEPRPKPVVLEKPVVAKPILRKEKSPEPPKPEPVQIKTVKFEVCIYSEEQMKLLKDQVNY